ncbi:MAG: hypothetical protein J6K26_03870 [Lachnospiraceae bacterium]|nr:hypothetical protein [Lachnospiraceae bacterium]
MTKKNKASISNKIYRKLHWILFSKIKPGKWINSFYASYRHRNKKPASDADRRTVYITQVPNEGAGIGHQIANFNGGVHYSMLFDIPFAYPGFKNKEWERFLGFGEDAVSIKELKRQGYKTRLLPYFNESEESLSLIRKIIASYAGEKVILCVELDQFYQKQYEVIPYIKERFEKASARKEDHLIYQKNRVSMAVHIRRGDIVAGQQSGAEGMTKRWLSLDYFKNIVRQVSEIVGDRLDIYLFSQGDPAAYRCFEEYGNVIYCFDMPDQDSFLHMVRADILVISKSSFSYKPALLSDGIRICPPDFWHGYPEDEKWVAAEEDGHLPAITSMLQHILPSQSDTHRI